MTRERFDEIVAELRDKMETDHLIQFVVGDRALEVEPMRPQHSEALVTIATITLMTRRLTQPSRQAFQHGPARSSA
ncbi:hypothetical protein [Streptomyces chartreusis]|uniref:hypothetical protein n=1 Tax=Streptomyces chartreusis TaxID=1969 RepID=UPI0038216963